MSQREFTAIRTEMQEGFGAVDRRFDAIDGKFDAMDGKFDALTQILSEIRKDNKEIKKSVMTVNLDYSELRTRVERLEKKVGLSGQHQS